jgi:hypothetical protein
MFYIQLFRALHTEEKYFLTYKYDYLLHLWKIRIIILKMYTACSEKFVESNLKYQKQYNRKILHYD